MPSLVIRLLGRPEIERGGVVVASPRGHKPWAVLAFLVLAERRVARARLAELIFGDADDPLGALRWTLSELRRALGSAEALHGDPLELRLPAGSTVDVVTLLSGGADPELVRGGLLDGADPGAGPVFDAWLLVERRRVAGACEAMLRNAALGALAAGRPVDGAVLASRGISSNAFDEGAHELLVRCLVAADGLEAARRHVDACEAMFRRELGRAPDPRVRRAADAAGSMPPAAGDRAAVLGQLEAGRAAVAAGAVEPGVACLRHACTEARGVADPALLAHALAELGAALVHAVRGRDEEGAAILHEALALAEEAGAGELAGQACRELGFIDVQAGRGSSAGRWLLRASGLAVADAERAAVLGVRGMALSDRARYEAATTLLGRSVAMARRCRDTRQAAWSLALLGRALLLCDRLPAAVEALDESLTLVAREGWVAFQPFPEALRAEVALREGDTAQAARLLDHAFALGCRLGDPCWEAMAARAQGLLHEAAGERTRALACLRDATARAVRVADPYVWILAYCLEALAAVAIDEGAPDADEHVTRLERLAARGDMRELVARAALHRARLGHAAGLGPAWLLGEAIDNPALHADLTLAVRSHAPSHGGLMVSAGRVHQERSRPCRP